MEPNVIGDDPSYAKPQTHQLARLGCARDPEKGLQYLRQLEDAQLECTARVLAGRSRGDLARPRPVPRGSRRARFAVKGATAGPSGSSLGVHSRSVATKCAALPPSRVLNFPVPDPFRSFVNPRHAIWRRCVAGITGGGARRRWSLKDSVLPGKTARLAMTSGGGSGVTSTWRPRRQNKVSAILGRVELARARRGDPWDVAAVAVCRTTSSAICQDAWRPRRCGCPHPRSRRGCVGARLYRGSPPVLWAGRRMCRRRGPKKARRRRSAAPAKAPPPARRGGGWKRGTASA